MQINLCLNSIEKEINDIANAIDIIKLCDTKEKSNIIKTSERLLKEMKYCFDYLKNIKEKFILELKKNKEFVQANILILSDGDYTVDILVNEFNDDIKEKYRKIYEAFVFSEQNDIYFNFNIYDYGSYDFEELEDYDYLKCL